MSDALLNSVHIQLTTFSLWESKCKNAKNVGKENPLHVLHWRPMWRNIRRIPLMFLWFMHKYKDAEPDVQGDFDFTMTPLVVRLSLRSVPIGFWGSVIAIRLRRMLTFRKQAIIDLPWVGIRLFYFSWSVKNSESLLSDNIWTKQWIYAKCRICVRVYRDGNTWGK